MDDIQLSVKNHVRNLYGVPAKDLKFGINPDSHVSHIILDEDKGIPLDFSEDAEKALLSGKGSVSKKETFISEGDKKTAERFKKLAIESEKDFADRSVCPEIRNLATDIKNYITASGRASQQNALKIVNMHIASYAETLKSRIEKEPNEKDQRGLERLAFYTNQFALEMNGNLKIPADKEPPKPKAEPQQVFLGRLGHWQKSDNVLFPHEPSPNDIKQGVGVQDCFALSVLVKIAAKNPEKIKNAMKDNNDGTVTIRFLNKAAEKPEDREVFIRVNKTVNQDAFGNNLYASSSLWVQMLEKGFAEYGKQYGMENYHYSDITMAKYRGEKMPITPVMDDEEKKLQSGMGSIFFDSSAYFMNAFLDEDYAQTLTPLYSVKKIYEKSDDGSYPNHPDYYLPEEKQVYEVLENAVNKEGSYITAMPDKLGRHAHDVGLRNGHIYSMNKVFEKDGKKFIQLRDPYATFKAGYEGDKLVNQSETISATINAGSDNMGTFNLELKDFFRYFNSLPGCPVKVVGELHKIQKIERDYDSKQYALKPEEMHGEENYDHTVMEKKLEEDRRKEEEKRRKDNEAEEKKRQKAEEKRLKEEQQAKLRSEEEKRESIERANAQVRFHTTSFGAEQKSAIVQYVFNGGAKTLKTKLEECLSDLAATDEMFVLTNSQEFKQMRDGLKDLTKDLGGKFDEQKIAEKVQKLGELATQYVNYKEQNITKDYSKGKAPSDRAMHRFAAAVNIQRLCSLEQPMEPWPTKDVEKMRIYQNDLNRRVEALTANGGQPLPHDKMTLAQAQLAQKNFNTYLDKNPKIKAALNSAPPKKAEPEKVLGSSEPALNPGK